MNKTWDIKLYTKAPVNQPRALMAISTLARQSAYTLKRQHK